MARRCDGCERLSAGPDVLGPIENPDCSCELPTDEPPHAGVIAQVAASIAASRPLYTTTAPACVDRWCEIGHHMRAPETSIGATCERCGHTWVVLLPCDAETRSARAAALALLEDERARGCDASAERELVPSIAAWWRGIAGRARENATRLRGLVIAALDVAAEE